MKLEHLKAFREEVFLAIESLDRDDRVKCMYHLAYTLAGMDQEIRKWSERLPCELKFNMKSHMENDPEMIKLRDSLNDERTTKN